MNSTSFSQVKKVAALAFLFAALLTLTAPAGATPPNPPLLIDPNNLDVDNFPEFSNWVYAGRYQYTDPAVADLNGDGHLDVVAPTLDTVGPTIWINGGDAWSSRPAEADVLSPGAASYGVAVGDLDNDGDVDIFAAHLGATNQVWLNDGVANFTAGFNTGESAPRDSYDVALGDLDGDGYLDAVVANDQAQDRVWFNNGDATFTEQQAFGDAAGEGREVSLGDVNGDGHLDAVIARYGGQPVRVWLNDGAGNFSLGSEFGATYGEKYTGVDLGDVDNDGDLDAVLAFDGSSGINVNTETVYFNDGSGVFSGNGLQIEPEPIEAADVELGDWDRDGDLDLLVAYTHLTTFRVNINQGGAQGGTPGDFGEGFAYRYIDGASVYARGGAWGDFDGDGDLDVVVSPNNASHPTFDATDLVWLQTDFKRDNGPLAANSSTLPIGDDGRDIRPADFDGDGNLDVLVAYDGGVSIWVGDGAGGFASWHYYSDASPYVRAAAAGDWNGDGDPDVVIARDGNNKVALTGGSLSYLSQETDSQDVAVADFDGDGNLDLFFANYGEANHVWLGDGAGGFGSAPAQALGSDYSTAVALGDVDRDGDVDAFVANYGSGHTVWLNDGGGVFSDSGQRLGARDSTAVALGDVDNDGDLDAVIANDRGANTIWLNDGNGRFHDSRVSLGADDSSDVALGDVDNDGDLDIFFADSDGDDHLWLNNGQGVFGSQTVGNADSGAAALGDVDNDGDADAITLPLFSGDVLLWRNELPHRNAPLVSDQGFDSRSSQGVAVGDLDGDGDLDAFVANDFADNRVWFNDGRGALSDSGQSLGSGDSTDVALGDLDGDGDLDAFVTNGASYQSSAVWLNDGSGFFTHHQSLSDDRSWSVDLGDVDGDGDLDALVTNYDSDAGDADQVWHNDGSGSFSLGQSLPHTDDQRSMDAKWGDLDGDGDLDALVTKIATSSKAGYFEVWQNNGGSLTLLHTDLGDERAWGFDLGDLDGDGDLDAFFGGGGKEVWFNDGSGGFALEQGLGGISSGDVSLGDLDGDGDLDAFVANRAYGTWSDSQTNWVFYNDGSGHFNYTGVPAGEGASWAGALGDLDGDGDLDALAANFDSQNRVLFNEGGAAALTVANTFDTGYIPDGAEGDVLRLDVAHNGAAGDVDLQLYQLRPEFYRSDCATPLTGNEMYDLFQEIRLRLDDGDGVFETDGSDVIVASVPDTWIGDWGYRQPLPPNPISASNTNARVSAGGGKSYWLSLLVTNNASQYPSYNNVCVKLDPDAHVWVRGKNAAGDFFVSIADTTATETGDVPTAVTLQRFMAREAAPVAPAGWLLAGIAALGAAAGLVVWRRR